MEQLHLAVLVLHWIWDALAAYANTPAGQAGLSDIEAVVNAIEQNQPHQASAEVNVQEPATPSGSPQIIRR